MDGHVALFEQRGLFFVMVSTDLFTRIVGPAPDESAARQFADELITLMAGDDGEVLCAYDRREQKSDT